MVSPPRPDLLDGLSSSRDGARRRLAATLTVPLRLVGPGTEAALTDALGRLHGLSPWCAPATGYALDQGLARLDAGGADTLVPYLGSLLIGRLGFRGFPVMGAGSLEDVHQRLLSERLMVDPAP